MAKKKKKMPGLNTSSTADISFMLLIFFLVTTSMDSDKGLLRQLPPPPENQDQTVQINERNIFTISIASSGKMVICGDYSNPVETSPAELKQLREQVKEFIKGNPHPHSTERPDVEILDVNGKPTVCYTKHVISLQADRGTPYEKYFDVQNEIVAAYNEVREAKSKEMGNYKPFAELDEERQAPIKAIYPQKISEAEPINYAEKFAQ
ncbi:MAG: biopolymer transporter ExbD [Bacteroidales bacterium]|nr:biopolymer transporter ExbD [Bacteroidales bacterium]